MNSMSPSLITLMHNILRRLIWIVIAAAVAAASVYFWAKSQDKLYRAEAEISYVPPRDGSQASAGSAISGVASLLGGGGASGEKPLALATLQSRDILARFVQRHSLMPLIFPKLWDKERGEWTVPAAKRPTLLDGAQRFRATSLNVEDAASGTIKVRIILADRRIVAALTNDLIASADRSLRTQAAEESEQRLAILRSELSRTTNAALQMSIAGLMTAELQRQTVATSGSYYAFRVIDPAVTPTLPSWPRPSLMAVAAGLLVGIAGGLVSVVMDLIGAERRRR